MNDVRFESPKLAHAKEIASLVQGTTHLDKNSNYTYALWCTHFS